MQLVINCCQCLLPKAQRVRTQDRLPGEDSAVPKESRSYRDSWQAGGLRDRQGSVTYLYKVKAGSIDICLLSCSWGEMRESFLAMRLAEGFDMKRFSVEELLASAHPWPDPAQPLIRVDLVAQRAQLRASWVIPLRSLPPKRIARLAAGPDAMIGFYSPMSKLRWCESINPYID